MTFRPDTSLLLLLFLFVSLTACFSCARATDISYEVSQEEPAAVLVLGYYETMYARTNVTSNFRWSSDYSDMSMGIARLRVTKSNTAMSNTIRAKIIADGNVAAETQSSGAFIDIEYQY